MEFSARQTRWMGIFSVAGGAIVIMLLVVIPTLQSYFASAGIPLPLPTRIVIGMSAFLKGYWWACVAGLVTLFLAIKQINTRAVEALLVKMEPIMIVVLGVVVGGMIVATWLPIFDMVNAVK